MNKALIKLSPRLDFCMHCSNSKDSSGVTIVGGLLVRLAVHHHLNRLMHRVLLLAILILVLHPLLNTGPRGCLEALESMLQNLDPHL